MYFFLSILVFFSPPLHGDALYDEAVQQFANNNTRDAVALFRTALSQGNINFDIFLYLAHGYEQLGIYDEGISVLEEGLEFSQGQRHVFYFNIGNLYLHKQMFDKALEYYDLAIGSSPVYAEAYLNRANITLKAGTLDRALRDYKSFVQIAPDHALVPDVQRMIAAITNEMKDVEKRRLEEEQFARLEAERRRLELLEAEQRAAEEEARRQALLDDILGNLDKAGDEGQTLGAGTEDISDEEDAFMRAE